MAKKNRQKDKLDIDLDNDLDFELDDIDFDIQSEPPPKNAREAVLRSGRDAGKGFLTELNSDKTEKIKKLAKYSIPGSLSTEFSQITSLIGDTKATFLENVSELKKTGKDTLKILNKFAPENSKLAKAIEKLSSKLSDDDALLKNNTKGPSQDEQIQQGILAALGELKTNSKATAAAQQAIANKQHATTAQLLQAIYGETVVQRNFHYKITNNYYRKSLELQFRMMFIQKEQLELTKAGFDTFKNQFESIVRNTGLPDVLKQRQSEMLKADFYKNMRASTLNTFYKTFQSPIEEFNKRLQSRLTNAIKDFTYGLKNFNDLGNEALIGVEMSDMMGGSGLPMPSKYQLAGNMLGSTAYNFLAGTIGNKIGRKIENTTGGKKAIFNIKNIMADPKYAIKQARDKLNKNTLTGKASDWLLGSVLDIFGDAENNVVNYGRMNLNEGAIFDGRTHLSINKIIPGYLSKIHAELKSLTIATAGKTLDSSKHELIYDTTTESFKTKSGMIKSIKKATATAYERNSAYYVKTIVDVLKNAGVNISGNEEKTFARAIVSYALTPGSYLNPTSLFSQSFFQHVQDEKLISKLSKNKQKIISYLENNLFEMDMLSSALSNVKSSLPSLTGRLTELEAGGNRSILKYMDVTTMDHNGNLYDNMQGRKNLLLDSIGGEIEKGTKNADLPSSMIGKSSSIAGRGLANKVDKKITSLTSLDSKTLGEQVVNTKTKVSDFIDKTLPPEQKKQVEKKLQIVKKASEVAVKEVEELIDKAPPGVKEELQEVKIQIQKEAGDIVKTVKQEGISNAATAVYKHKFANIVKNARSTVKSKISSGMSFFSNYKDDISRKGFIKSTFEKARSLDRKIVFNTPGVIAENGRKLAGKAYEMVKNHLKARPLEDLKQEYFNSKEYKEGSAPSFFTWISTMGYKIRRDISIKTIFKKTREWDRKIVGGALKFPFQFAAGLFGIKGKSAANKLGKVSNSLSKATGNAAIKTANAMLDMLPMGMGSVIKAPFSLMSEMVRLVGMLVPNAANTDEKRKNSWFSRLNIFKKDKKLLAEKDGILGKMKEFFKDHKAIGVTGLITLGIMGLNKAGISLDKIVSGVKTVAGVVSKVFDAIGKVGSYIGKAFHYLNPGNWFGNKDEVEVEEIVRDKDGNPVLNPDGTVKTQVVKKAVGEDGGESAGKTGSLVAKGAAGFLAYQAIRHPLRTFGKIASLGSILFSKILSVFRSPPIGANTNSGFIAKALSTVKSAAHWAASKTGILDKICGALNSVKDRFVKFIDKVFPSTNSIASKCKNVLNYAKSPTVVNKVGSSALKKGLIKLTSIIAAASTGIGILLSAAAVMWEIGWILWYMFHDDMTFKQAAMKQLFDIDKEDLKNIESEVQDVDIRNEERLMGLRSGKQESYSSFTHSVSGKIDKINASLKANDDAARKKYRQTAEAKKFDTKGVENKFAKHTDSPYILPMPQETMGGQRADVINLNTDIKDRIEQFAQKYYEVTGKQLPISSGKRSLEQQIKLWESQAKVKYTGNRAQDQANAKAAGGKFLGYNGGTIAYPNPNNSHIMGRAVDINIAATPYHNEVTANKRHWLFDDILEEYGLKRTMTTFNNANVAAGRVQSERWHIGLGGAPTAGNTEQGAPETKGLPASEKPKNVIAATTSTPTISTTNTIASTQKVATTPAVSKSQVINAATGNSGKSIANYDLIKNMENKKLKDAMNTAYMEDKDVLINGVPTKIGTKSTFNYAKTLSDSELLKNMKRLNDDIKNYDSNTNKKADIMMRWGTSDYNELSGMLTGYTMEAIARGLDKGVAYKSVSSTDNKKSIGDEDDGYYSSTLSSNKNYLSPLTKSSLARRTAFSSPTHTTTVKPNINFSTRTMEDVLQKSLVVQTQSMGYLKEIRDYMEQAKKANEVSVQTAQTQPQITSFPEPVINLSRQEKFDNVFV